MTDGAAVDLGAWANTYGLTAPVTIDTAGLASAFSIPAIPAQHIIARGGIIYSLNTRVTPEIIEEVLAFENK
jgi:hypothetical protein